MSLVDLDGEKPQEGEEISMIQNQGNEDIGADSVGTLGNVEGFGCGIVAVNNAGVVLD